MERQGAYKCVRQSYINITKSPKPRLSTSRSHRPGCAHRRRGVDVAFDAVGEKFGLDEFDRAWAAAARADHARTILKITPSLL